MHCLSSWFIKYNTDVLFFILIIWYNLIQDHFQYKFDVEKQKTNFDEWPEDIR